MSWHEGPLLGFDTETTGIDVDRDRIVTAALVRRDAEGTRVRTWLIDPGVAIPDAATAIHGVTTEHARAEGADPSAALEEIAALIAAALRDGTPVVAYNASFDLRLLDAELRRHGLATLPDRLGHDTRPVVDPLVLDRTQDAAREGQRTLGDLCGVYRVQPGVLHTADVDVVATLDVLDRIVRRFPHLAGQDLETLHDEQAAAYRAWAAGVNAMREEQGRTGRRAEEAWPAREPVGTLW